MSKVYIIFLFLLSGAVQLSYTNQSSSQVHGNVFLFINGKFDSFQKLNDNSRPYLGVNATYKDCSTKNIFYLEVTQEGICYLTCLDIMFDKKNNIQNAQVNGTGICLKNQKISRWHIQGPEEIGKKERTTYDLIFVRDTSIKIREESLKYLPINPIAGYKTAVIQLLSQYVSNIKTEL